MTVLYLGNTVDGAKTYTEVVFPEHFTLAEQFRNITDPDGVWNNHTYDVESPNWVATDSAGLAALLSEHYGITDIREPLPVSEPDTGGEIA